MPETPDVIYRYPSNWTIGVTAVAALVIGLAIMYAIGVYYEGRQNAGNRNAS